MYVLLEVISQLFLGDAEQNVFTWIGINERGNLEKKIGNTLIPRCTPLPGYRILLFRIQRIDNDPE